MDCEHIAGAVKFISRRLGRRSSRITEQFESLRRVILADETHGMFFGRISYALEDFLGNPLVGLVPKESKMFEFNCWMQAALLSVRLSVFELRMDDLCHVRELEREMHNNPGDHVHPDLEQCHFHVWQAFLSCQVETQEILHRTRRPVFQQILGKTRFDFQSIQCSLTTPGQSVLFDIATKMRALFIQFFQMRLENVFCDSDLALIIEERTESHVSESASTVHEHIASKATSLVENQLFNHPCQ